MGNGRPWKRQSACRVKILALFAPKGKRSARRRIVRSPASRYAIIAGMYFATPAAVAGGAAGVGPGAVHLYRARFRRRGVSSLMLWRFAVRPDGERRRRDRLRTPPVFYLESLVLPLFVLAASVEDPVVLGSDEAASDAIAPDRSGAAASMFAAPALRLPPTRGASAWFGSATMPVPTATPFFPGKSPRFRRSVIQFEARCSRPIPEAAFSPKPRNAPAHMPAERRTNDEHLPGTSLFTERRRRG